MSLQGSYIPFAATPTERAGKHDPRPAVTERYASRAHYLGLVTEHALALAEAGYVRREDVAAIAARAAEHFDHASRGAAAAR